jgi:hypothetical protein
MSVLDWRIVYLFRVVSWQKNNAQQVAKIRRIVEELGNVVATPDEAREMLALKGGDRVKF